MGSLYRGLSVFEFLRQKCNFHIVNFRPDFYHTRWYLFMWFWNTVTYTLIMRLVTLVTYWNTRVVKKMGDIFEGTPIFLEILKWKEREIISQHLFLCFDKWQIDRPIYMGMEEVHTKNGNCTSWKTDRKLLYLQSETWQHTI